MFFGGYMAAVPVLSALTDRMDARRVYVFACVLGAAGSLGFALLVEGLYAALVCHALIGAGLAGTYMPGLKLLSDRIEGHPRRSRYVAFYTATFGLGTTLSLAIVGVVEPALGWQATFLVSALGPLAAGALVWLGVAPLSGDPAPGDRAHLLDFRPVFANRAATGYILGYAVHCYELFGMRSWLVAFIAFSAALQPPEAPMPWNPAWIAAALMPLGMASSILGNELAARLRRRDVILGAMVLAMLTAWGIGFLAPLPWYVVVLALAGYTVFVMADSAALTAGVVAEAHPSLRGATMAMHSFLGFGAGMIAPLVFGVVLDLAGGNDSAFAWGLAFATLSIGGVLGPLAVVLSRRVGGGAVGHAPARDG
jgi:MFS family permease